MTEPALQARLAAQAAAEKTERDQALARRRAEDAARVAQTNAIARDANLAQQQAETAHEARLKALRAECGADFQRPQIGMPLARAQRCVGDLVLFSQLNRADGVASVYKAGPLYVTVLGDKVVHWTNTQPPR